MTKQKIQKLFSVILALALVFSLFGCGQREKTKEITKFSSDLYSYKIKLDGVIYKIPYDFHYFEDRGWIMEENPNLSLSDKLENNSYTADVSLKKGDSQILADFVNYTDSPEKYEDCKIGAVTLKPGDVSFVLPGGVDNDSSYEEIKKLLGEPVSYYESGNGEKETMFYTQEGENRMITIVWDKTNEKIYQLCVKYHY